MNPNDLPAIFVCLVIIRVWWVVTRKDNRRAG